MKKIFILLVLVLSVFVANAQTGRTYSIAVDTIKGAETVNFDLNQITGSYNYLSIQALCTNIGGTSDGTLVLDVSVDGTSYETITTTSGVMNGYPNDTLTILDAAVANWLVEGVPFKYYRIKGAGTSGDTTAITVKYVYK